MLESVGMFLLGCVFFTKRESEKYQFVKSSVLVYLGQYNENTIDLVTYGQTFKISPICGGWEV